MLSLLTLPFTLQSILTTFLWPKERGAVPVPPLTFELRHQHGVSNSSRVIFSDVAPSFAPEAFWVNTKQIDVHRPSSFSAFSNARTRSMRSMENEFVQWDQANVAGPNVESRETLLQLAKMMQNSYASGPENTSEWYDVGENWNTSNPFGWEPTADGFRGHVFVSSDNSTVIISIKGTSAGWMAGSGGPTIKKDKLNDNLLFSCCCAKVGPTWFPVCDCASGGYTCDQNCLEKSLLEESLFYPIGLGLYNNVTYMYPDANIWVIGHSLGGSLASLLGVTFGVPVVTFEAPGERMAAARLHLPSPPSTQHITHFWHTADPVPMGICNGVTSTCAMAGYAMESRCHLGKVARYDTVTKFGWTPDLRTHGIVVVIDKILNEDWEPADENGEGGREVPVIEEEQDCVDCYNWEYGNFKKNRLSDQTEH